MFILIICTPLSSRQSADMLLNLSIFEYYRDNFIYLNKLPNSLFYSKNG
jgi:hypothetical protein